MMRGKREQAGLLAVIIGITATVTACGPRQAHADVGMTVDEAGNPVIVLQVCEGVIDELRLGYPWPTPTPQPDRPEVKLTSRKPFKGVAQIPLYEGGSGWKPVSAIPALAEAGEYSIATSGDDGEWFGGYVKFTLADLKALKPGQIRHHIPAPQTATTPYKTARFSGSDYYWVTSLDDFANNRCPK